VFVLFSEYTEIISLTALSGCFFCFFFFAEVRTELLHIIYMHFRLDRLKNFAETTVLMLAI
jgi:hypothetical protein